MSDDIPPGYEAYEPTWEETFLLDVGVVLLWTLANVSLLAASVALAVRLAPAMSNLWLGPSVLGIIGVTAILHEGVHAGVGWLLVYHVSAGIDTRGWGIAPYIVAAGAYRTRREEIAVTLAPLVVLDLCMLGVIAIAGLFSLPGLVAAVALCFNTAGSTRGGDSDLGNAYRVSRLSPQAKIKDEPHQQRIYIRPKTPHKSRPSDHITQ